MVTMSDECAACGKERKGAVASCPNGHWVHFHCYVPLLTTKDGWCMAQRCGKRYEASKGIKNVLRAAIHTESYDHLRFFFKQYGMKEVFCYDLSRHPFGGYWKAVDRLLHLFNQNEMDALLRCSMKKNPCEYSFKLVVFGANINQTTEHGTFLHYAVKFKEHKDVKWLLNCGADVHARDANGMTPLCYAVTRKKLHMVETLLRHGSDPNVFNSFGDTPLLMAMRCEDFHAGFLLRKFGARYDVRDENGNTLLHAAVRTKLPNKHFSLLVKGHCRSLVNVANNNGHTPLDFMIFFNDRAKASILDYYHHHPPKDE